jgi:hypothetical protein
MDSDSTAHAEIRELVSLEEADAFVLGWKERVFYELDQMRKQMPYADTLELRLTSTRRPD